MMIGDATTKCGKPCRFLASEVRYCFLSCCLLPSLLLAQAPDGAAPKLIPLPYPEIPPPPVPLPPVPWLIVFGGSFIITALVALLLWLCFKMPRHKRQTTTPLQSAMSRLEKLESFVGQIPAGEISHHVSVILRDYMEARYQMPALARTTPELFEQNSAAMLNHLRERFCPVAAMYDRLSFAPQPAAHDDAVALIKSALHALHEEGIPSLSPPIPVN